MRASHLVEEPPRKAAPSFSNEEIVGIGIICATLVTLIALVQLVHLSLILG